MKRYTKTEKNCYAIDPQGPYVWTCDAQEELFGLYTHSALNAVWAEDVHIRRMVSEACLLAFDKVNTCKHFALLDDIMEQFAKLHNLIQSLTESCKDLAKLNIEKNYQSALASAMSGGQS